ncbi:unnamed protein product [Fasciola hepatica]|uniref:Uncharacterized protein n=1 Tax=Fasciola hepatica TaxID=6192 RepID=A0ABC9HIK8_FASHE
MWQDTEFFNEQTTEHSSFHTGAYKLNPEVVQSSTPSLSSYSPFEIILGKPLFKEDIFKLRGTIKLPYASDRDGFSPALLSYEACHLAEVNIPMASKI